MIVSVSFVSCKNEDGCKYRSANGCICILRDVYGMALHSCSRNDNTVARVIMYPNPASNTIYFYFQTVPCTVIIESRVGKELYRQITNDYCLAVDISDFRDGTYLVKVDDGTQKSNLCLFKDSGEPCR